MKALRCRFFFAVASLAAAQPKFDVASIKAHPGPINFSRDPSPRGHAVTGTASTLLDLITTAYGVRYDQIAGAPGWAGNDHYDLAAKAEGEGQLSPEEFQQMMQSLLADRFQLVIHRETREIPAYALVIGKNGPKLQPSEPGATGGNITRGTTSGSLIMEVKQGTLDQLAAQLSRSAGRPVVNRTALTGLYQYRLEWLPENRVADTESSIPSVFTAIQELGLKLEPVRAPYEFVVIDHAQKPSEN